MWRVVLDPELEDLKKAGGEFRLPEGRRGWGGGKYFSETAEGASSYAQQAHRAWPDDGPYTLVETVFPTELITKEMVVPVDGDIPAVVVPENDFQTLNRATILNSAPIPRRD